MYAATPVDSLSLTLLQVQRAKEIKQLKRFAYLLAALMFFILSLSSILCVSTFTAYALLGKCAVVAVLNNSYQKCNCGVMGLVFGFLVDIAGHELKAEKVFPSLVVIRSLMWTILLLPATSNRL